MSPKKKVTTRKKPTKSKNPVKKKISRKAKPPKAASAKKKTATAGPKIFSKDLNCGLNGPQIDFCHNIADGMSQTWAYKDAYPGCAAKSRASKASRLVRKGNIISKIADLRISISTHKVLDRNAKREILAGVIMDGRLPLSNRLAALKVDNQIAGHNSPEKVLIGAEKSMKDILEKLRNGGPV